MRSAKSKLVWLWLAHACAGYGAFNLTAGCGEVREDGGTDSNTHWLEPCRRDADCGELACVCGQCTQPCENDGACGVLPGASCALANACAPSNDAPSCVAECVRDADCAAVREGLECADGQCRPRPEPGGSGGSDGTGGTVAGTGGSVAGAGANAGSGGESGSALTGTCDAMDALPSLVNLPCAPGPSVYAWNGTHCYEFSEGCQCLGEDCDELYPTMEACDSNYAACYRSQGITGACEDDDDCKLTFRGCCEPCGFQRLDVLAATTESEEARWHGACEPDAGCTLQECAEPFQPSPEARAECVESRCQVVSRCEGRDAEECEEVEGCVAMYGSPRGSGEQVYGGCARNWRIPAEGNCAVGVEVCGTPREGGDCLNFGLLCTFNDLPRNWSAQDCQSAACLP